MTHQSIKRCAWCSDDDEYCRYHDEEWGTPVECDNALFEKICLEGFQAGLSWITILKRREAFRRAFTNFEIETVARFSHQKIDVLSQDKTIIRHRGKIQSVINNAQKTLQIQTEFGSLLTFLLQFWPAVERPATPTASQSPESIALAKALKQRGFTFVGATTMYAFMQSMGFVNDHEPECHAYAKTQTQRQQFSKSYGLTVSSRAR